MKYLVPLSLLFVGMAKGQDVDAASLNAILPEGYTKVCEDDTSAPRGKRQAPTQSGPPPCWTLVEPDFDRSQCAGFEGTCTKAKPYVGRGNTTMCIFFPAAGKWFKLGGTYGWCGADNCCDFHPKNQCNPSRPLATFFPFDSSSYSSCDDVPDKDNLSVVGSELMKGQEGEQREVCILNKDKVWVKEPVNMVECGGFGCCRFEFVNAPPQE